MLARVGAVSSSDSHSIRDVGLCPSAVQSQQNLPRGVLNDMSSLHACNRVCRLMCRLGWSQWRWPFKNCRLYGYEAIAFAAGFGSSYGAAQCLSAIEVLAYMNARDFTVGHAVALGFKVGGR